MLRVAVAGRWLPRGGTRDLAEGQDVGDPPLERGNFR